QVGDPAGAHAGLEPGPRTRDPGPPDGEARASRGAPPARVIPLAGYHHHVPAEITCLIVDDHEVVREGLRLSLSRSPHIRVVGEAGDGQGAIDLAERRRPDVVIMDVRMPGMDGLDATKELTQRTPETAV